MRTLIAALSLTILHAQPAGDFLRPQAHHVSGVVVDEAGLPVFNASIDYTQDRYPPSTDKQGRFQIDTRAPAVVIRRTGYRSVFLPTEPTAEPRITLQAVATQPFRECPSKGDYVGIDGWQTWFRFLKIPGVSPSPEGRDSDYGYRSYSVEASGGPKRVFHGAGPMWGGGRPLVQYIWRSQKYDEIAYSAPFRQEIVDARGEFANGRRWRSLGRFGETATYSDVDPATAKILDQLLDSACITVPSRQ